MDNDMTTHLNEDDLVLHYYGEMAPATRRAPRRTCATCTRLPRELHAPAARAGAVEAAPGPEIADGFERMVWARLEPALGRQRRGWISWFVFSPARLAWAGAVVVLIAGAFFAGRLSRATVPAPAGADRNRRGSPRADPARRPRRSPRSVADDAGRAGERGRRRRASTSRRSARAPSSSWPPTGCIGRPRRRPATWRSRPCSTSSSACSWSSRRVPERLSAGGPRRVRQRIDSRGPALQGARGVVADARAAENRRSGCGLARARSRSHPSQTSGRSSLRPPEETGYRIMNIRHSRVCSIVFAGALVAGWTRAGAAGDGGGETRRATDPGRRKTSKVACRRAVRRMRLPARRARGAASQGLKGLDAGSTSSSKAAEGLDDLDRRQARRPRRSRGLQGLREAERPSTRLAALKDAGSPCIGTSSTSPGSRIAGSERPPRKIARRTAQSARRNSASASAKRGVYDQAREFLDQGKYDRADRAVHRRRRR